MSKENSRRYAFDGSNSLSISTLLRQAATRSPGRIFATHGNDALSIRDLDSLADRIAGHLGALISKRARVAVMARNSPAVAALILAISRLGAVWVPINPALRSTGLSYIIKHSQPHIVLTDDEHFEICSLAVQTVTGSNGTVLRLDNLTNAPSSPSHFEEAVTQPDETFAVMYTSGTTGPPKGVEVTSRMMLAAAEAVIYVADVKPGDRMFMWEPMYHIGGAQMLIVPLLVDAELRLSARFSASQFWDEVSRTKCTHIHYLGGILQMLLKQPSSPLDRLHGTRVAWGGGCDKATWIEFSKRFGLELRECYGMTETSSIATANVNGVTGSVGTAVPWFNVSVVHPETKTPVATGETGEILVEELRPGLLSPGYYQNEVATKESRHGSKSRLLTGDLGYFDPDGNLIFLGRISDSFRVRGENVSSWDVEHVAREHPDVADCALVGVKAEVGEFDLKLFLEPRPGASIDFAPFSAWLSQRLAAFQNPRYLAIAEQFDRTPSQRIMKHFLSKNVDDCFDRFALKDSR